MAPPPRHVVCAADELPPGSRTIVEIDGRSIGVFNVDGELFAIRNSCPHRGAPLCEGTIGGTMLPSDPHSYVYGLREPAAALPVARLGDRPRDRAAAVEQPAAGARAPIRSRSRTDRSWSSCDASPTLSLRRRSQTTLVDEIVDAIRDRIVRGELEPGLKIRQQEFAEVLGVSRTPLREAFQRLEADGWVQLEARRGAEVRAADGRRGRGDLHDARRAGDGGRAPGGDARTPTRTRGVPAS